MINAINPVSDGNLQGVAPRFSDLGVSDSILDVLKNLNLSQPTPIQQKTIPIALKGQDLIGIAQTGTGKTFAFGIPMLQNLGANKGQGLVIAPTRELALQIAENLKKLGLSFGLRTAILIGGEALDRQLFQLRKKPHVIIATPGRLIDHLKRKTLKLDNTKVLVLDEADMMLDLGFAPQIKEILNQAPQDRQTMIFSATMPAAIVKIAATYMKLPVSIETAPPGTTAAKVDQEIFIINGEDRLKYLEKLLVEHSGSVLVFLRTKHSVKNLTAKLQSLGYKAAEIHSNLSLNRRRASLDDFKSGKAHILVATDVAARGLDINGIELVVNYNLPDNTDDYVHRIGRTGRAEKTGRAVSFATPNEQKEIREIEKLINKAIKQTRFSSAVAPFPSEVAGRNRKKRSGEAGYRSQAKRPVLSRQTGGEDNRRQRNRRQPITVGRTEISRDPLDKYLGNSPLVDTSRHNRSQSHSSASRPRSAMAGNRATGRPVQKKWGNRQGIISR